MKLKIKQSGSSFSVYQCRGYEMEMVFSSKSIADCYAFVKSTEENLFI
jgi:hypothetical protein